MLPSTSERHNALDFMGCDLEGFDKTFLYVGPRESKLSANLIDC